MDWTLRGLSCKSEAASFRYLISSLVYGIVGRCGYFSGVMTQSQPSLGAPSLDEFIATNCPVRVENSVVDSWDLSILFESYPGGESKVMSTVSRCTNGFTTS